MRWIGWSDCGAWFLRTLSARLHRTCRGSLSSGERPIAGIERRASAHRPEDAEAKILAAYEAGCRRFDSALTGLGGCPFAGDNLVGNIATEDVLAALKKAGADPGIDASRLGTVLDMANEIRAKYAHAPLVN
jgi:hypothetical protein